MKSHIAKLNENNEKKKRQDQIARQIKAGLENDYRTIFTTPEGQRVLNDILTMTHQFHTSFSFDGKKQTDFREGERNVGLKLIAKMNKINQDALFKAMKINLSKEYKKK